MRGKVTLWDDLAWLHLHWNWGAQNIQKKKACKLKRIKDSLNRNAGWHINVYARKSSRYLNATKYSLNSFLKLIETYTYHTCHHQPDAEWRGTHHAAIHYQPSPLNLSTSAAQNIKCLTSWATGYSVKTIGTKQL